MYQAILGILLIVAIPNVSFGQNSSASWQNLERLKTGNTIRVVQANSPDIVGKFLRSTSDQVSIQVNKKETSVQRVDVLRIDVRKRYKRILHALIGAGLGAAAGIAVFAGAQTEDSFYGIALPLFPVLVGAGTTTGALLPGYSTVYKAP